MRAELLFDHAKRVLHLRSDGSPDVLKVIVIDPIAAKRAGLQVTSCDVHGHSLHVTPAIAFRPGAALPPSLNMPCRSAALVIPGMADSVNGDGQLGAGYL